MAAPWSRFHLRLHRLLLRRPQLLPQHATLLLAVSGGQDSMALVGLLRDLQRLHHWRLLLWHGDHGWRPESAQQASALRLQLTLGSLFLMFTGCELLLPESGLPAAVAAGVVVGRRPDTDAAGLDDLIRQLAQLAITMLFPLLAADVSFAQLSPLGWGGVACVLAMMVLQRPLAIGLATWGMGFSLKQQALLAWLAPRGVVTAAVASLFAIRLEQAGVLGAGRLQGLVFLTILLTVGLQGLTAGPLARRLGLVEREAAGPSEAALNAGQGVAAALQQQPGGE